jgi:hypothetical protein
MIREHISKLLTLTSIRLALEKNGLKNKGLSIMSIINTLPYLEQFSLNLCDNRFDVVKEMQSLSDFNRQHLLNLKSFEVKINDH